MAFEAHLHLIEAPPGVAGCGRVAHYVITVWVVEAPVSLRVGGDRPALGLNPFDELVDIVATSIPLLLRYVNVKFRDCDSNIGGVSDIKMEMSADRSARLGRCSPDGGEVVGVDDLAALLGR